MSTSQEERDVCVWTMGSQLQQQVWSGTSSVASGGRNDEVNNVIHFLFRSLQPVGSFL